MPGTGIVLDLVSRSPVSAAFAVRSFLCNPKARFEKDLELWDSGPYATITLAELSGKSSPNAR